MSEQFVYSLVAILVFGMLIWLAWKVLAFFWALLVAASSLGPPEQRREVDGDGNHPDGMNEGDFHSGPEGYGSGTACHGVSLPNNSQSKNDFC